MFQAEGLARAKDLRYDGAWGRDMEGRGTARRQTEVEWVRPEGEERTAGAEYQDHCQEQAPALSPHFLVEDVSNHTLCLRCEHVIIGVKLLCVAQSRASTNVKRVSTSHLRWH